MAGHALSKRLSLIHIYRAPIGANLYNVRTTLTFTSTILGNPQDGGANCEA